MSSSTLNISRDIISRITGGNHQMTVALEELFEQVGGGLPTTIEQAAQTAAQALSVAQTLTDQAERLVGALEALSSAPEGLRTELEALREEVAMLQAVPALSFGTMALQDADNVDITGGRIGLSDGAVDAPSYRFQADATTGWYRIDANRWGFSIEGVKKVDLSAAAFGIAMQLISTVATGTAPFAVASTTKVDNLNADKLDGKDWAAPGFLGETTPAKVQAAEFACNGLPAQPRYPVPAEANTPATVQALVNALRAALVNNGIAQ